MLVCAVHGNEAGWVPGSVREIVRGPAELHESLRRVVIDWRVQHRVDWPQIASWMVGHAQALCVVNLRDHAATLFD